MSVADLTEQLAQTEQLVAQLKELVKEKDNELRSKEQRLKVFCVFIKIVSNLLMKMNSAVLLMDCFFPQYCLYFAISELESPQSL